MVGSRLGQVRLHSYVTDMAACVTPTIPLPYFFLNKLATVLQYYRTKTKTEGQTLGLFQWLPLHNFTRVCADVAEAPTEPK